jgi:PIN domain nuclease of toxin-antitoxin system
LTYLDTYSVVRLYAGDIGALSLAAKAAIEHDDDLLISPMVLLELHSLRERKRVVRDSWRDIAVALEVDWGVRVCHHPFASIAATAADRVTWTADPFDRLIVAHAMANGDRPLVTPDRLIRARYHASVW